MTFPSGFKRNDQNVGDTETIGAYERWLQSTSRADGTITLRMRHVRAVAARFNMLTLTTDDVESIMGALRRMAPETRKSWQSSLRLFYRWAIRKGLVAVDPTVDVESVRIPVRVPHIAPDRDVLQALTRATVHERAMVLLARYGCLRLTELTTLPLTAREGHLLRFVGKGDKERVVGLNAPLLDALLTIEPLSTTGFYFPGRVGPHMHPQAVSKIIHRLTGHNPHSLRHAGATAAYNNTHDLRAVQAMLGHASLLTTQRYLHLDDDSLQRVADATLMRRGLTLVA